LTDSIKITQLAIEIYIVPATRSDEVNLRTNRIAAVPINLILRNAVKTAIFYDIKFMQIFIQKKNHQKAKYLSINFLQR
jgi:hypothetical protein